jgi:hypothetical protein
MNLRSNNLSSGRLKNDFGEVDDAMFQGGQEAIRNQFLHPEHRKKRLG